MAKKKKEVELPERSALESLAKEMNEVMGLDPKIKFNRKTTDEELIEAIKENAVDEETNEPAIYHSDFEEDENDPEKDVFSDEAKETLEALEIEIGDEPEDEGEEEPEEEEEKPAKKGKKDEKPAKKGKKDEEEDEEDEKPAKKSGKGKKKEEPEEEDEPEEKPKKGSKKKAKDEDDEEDEKPAKGKKGVKEDKPAKKREKGTKFTRYMAVASVFKEGKALTEEQYAEKADAVYCKNNGNSGVAQSERIVDRALQLLRALGLVEEKNGKIKYTGE